MLPNVKIEKIKGGKRGIVVIVHDDGTPSTCEYLKGEAEKNGICFTVALITSKIADPETGRLDPEAIKYWKGLVDTGYFGISSHSRTHRFWGLTDEDEDGFLVGYDGEKKPYSVKKGQITREIKGSLEDLVRAFPDMVFTAFIKPGIGLHESGVQLSERAKEIIAENYATMRNTGGGVDTVPPTNPQNVKSLMVRAGEDPESWIRPIDEAIEKNGMLVYVFHAINETEEGIVVSREKASKVFKYVGEKKKEGLLWVTTFEKMAQYTEEYKTARLVCAPTGNGFTVKIEDEKHGNEFSEPLTVRAEIPAGKTVGKASLNYETGNDENGAFILFDLTPNRETAEFFFD